MDNCKNKKAGILLQQKSFRSLLTPFHHETAFPLNKNKQTNLKTQVMLGQRNNSGAEGLSIVHEVLNWPLGLQNQLGNPHCFPIGKKNKTTTAKDILKLESITHHEMPLMSIIPSYESKILNEQTTSGYCRPQSHICVLSSLGNSNPRKNHLLALQVTEVE